MEDEADSRIVSRVANQWQLEQGPFVDTDFLRDGEWSLLVQRVNEWFPEVDALRGCVDFLPTWRFDDVMVSYATDGAGVGPISISTTYSYCKVQANGYGRLGLTVMLQRLRLTRTGSHLSKSLIQIRSSCSIREMRCTFRLDMPIGELR